MKKRGKRNIQINISNRVLYTLITLGIIAILGVGVYAYGTSVPATFGHSYNELQPCSGTQILKMNGAGAWTCQADATGLTTETDPTVLPSVKDGVSWAEITGTFTTYIVSNTGGYQGLNSQACNAGDVLISGGCGCGLCIGTTVRMTHPFDSTRWRCQCTDLSCTQVQVTAYCKSP